MVSSIFHNTVVNRYIFPVTRASAFRIYYNAKFIVTILVVEGRAILCRVIGLVSLNCRHFNIDTLFKFCK